MILRRVIQHVRKQEWTAIWIDLLIVVVGVFIGIQVSNWNEGRATMRRAEVFTERLRSDLREEAWGYEMQVGYYSEVAANGRRALDALAGRGSVSDEALLVAAYRATQYNGNTRRRATYDELTSRGEIGLVTDLDLRDLAQRVYSAPMFDYIVEEGRTSQYRQWFRLNIPHDVQQTLAKTCGDRYVVVGDYTRIAGSLDFPCSTGLPAETIKAAVSQLRDDPDAVRRLRLQVADVATGLSNLTVYNDTMRAALRAIAGRAP
ncbi:MAG: hypothetical protein LH470_04835 [Lysobacter sp.]|nr:hypothetical protein [Lysobacter sp.]